MSFGVAISGLNAASANLSVTGNNIANASTTGFKRARAEFVDVYPESNEGSGNKTPGSGVRLSAINQLFTQGNVEYTERNLDLAVSGQGFFVVSDNGTEAYTRAGSFHVDRDGYVVNSAGNFLQVYPQQGTTGTAFNTGIMQDLQLSTATVGQPAATTVIDTSVNIDAASTAFTVTAAGDNTSTVMSPTDGLSFHHSTSVNVYDSLGATHTATMYFRKVDTAGGTLPNTWQTFMFVDGVEVPPAGGLAGSAYVPAQASGDPAIVTFNTDGSLASVSPAAATAPSRADYSSFTPGGGATAVALDIDFSGTTQYGTEFSVSSVIQDGYSTGRLTDVEVENSGIVYARFSNGVSQVMGKVAMANFSNVQGLRQLGETTWAASFSSGDPIYGEATTGRFGQVLAGSLEASNVNLAAELVNLITAQRSFQANAQVISATDEVTQSIINMR